MGNSTNVVRVWVQTLAVQRELLAFWVLGAKDILCERQRVDGWVGRRQVPRMTRSTEKHTHPSTQVPSVASRS